VNQDRRFVWRLEELMHAHGIRHVTALQRELAERGIDLSSSQTHRLVTQTPDRLNLDVLAALCEILGCSPADLISIKAAERRKAAGAGNVVDMAATVRPKRAQVTRPSLPPEDQ
jgi:DNA-binding Xre family transcriptional regulator